MVANQASAALVIKTVSESRVLGFRMLAISRRRLMADLEPEICTSEHGSLSCYVRTWWRFVAESRESTISFRVSDRLSFRYPYEELLKTAARDS